MKRKFLAVLLLLGLLGTVLCGCGGGSADKTPEGGQTSGSNEPAAQPAETRANEITVGIAQDLDESLDPHVAVAAGTKEVMFNVFEGLVKPTPDGDLIPAVASAFTSDAATYTFTLREGVKFHNGDPVEMGDVIYSIDRNRLPGESGAEPLIPALAAIQSMEAEGDTLTITLDQPNNEFLSYLTLAILPEDYDGQDTAPVGTGPFKFVSRAAQDNIVLERFEDYWGQGAYLDKVTFKIIENSDSILMSLQSGAVDLFAHLTSTQAAQLGDEFNIEEGTMNLVQAMYLNHAEKPFDDVRVRQALCYAIDRQQILDLAFDGYGSLIGSSMYPAFGKYFDDSLTNYYTYDVEKAKSLLADAGYPDGFSMTITVPSNYQPHIDTYNTGESRGRELSHSLNYQKLGKALMDVDELAVMDGGKCILQLRGVRPFLSDKFDITQHPLYKYLADHDKKNAFDIARFLSTRFKPRPNEVYDVFEVDVSEEDTGSE